MKNNILKTVLAFFIIFSLGHSIALATAEEAIENIEAFTKADANIINSGEFAVDAQNGVFVLINEVDNTIEIIKEDATIEDGSKESKFANKKLLVDKFVNRHDAEYIFRPVGLAISKENIIYLANNQDSSLLRIVNYQGELLEEFYFEGLATEFSYNPEINKLYMAGNNPRGYDLFVLDVASKGEGLSISSTSNFNYTKPMKSDTIQENDKWGFGLMIIAMGTVFLTLLVIVLVLKGEMKVLLAIQNRKARKLAEKESRTTPIKKASDITGEEYAAIAAAIYMYNSELHDEENTILTIDRVQKSYSPWSSKVYGMNVYKR